MATSMEDTVMNFLTVRGLKMYHESEFVRDDNKEPMWGGFSGRYSACRAQEPDMGSRVSIKIYTQSNRDKILQQETNDREFAGEQTWQYFKRECCISKRNEAHPNIQKCLGVVNRFAGNELPGLVSKGVAVGDLKAFVREDERATITTKVQLMRDVAKGLEFLHERRVVHRNLKSNKILVDVQDGKLVALLSDFGSAKDFDDLLPFDYPLPVKASHSWMAPELTETSDRMHDFDNGAGDMWAFGCTMVEVLAPLGLIWPGDYDDDDIYYALMYGERPPRPAAFPPWDEAWNFIHDRCWNLDPKKRITSREAVVELEALLKTVPPSV